MTFFGITFVHILGRMFWRPLFFRPIRNFMTRPQYYHMTQPHVHNVWRPELHAHCTLPTLVFWKRGLGSLVWTDELVVSGSFLFWWRGLRQVWVRRMGWFRAIRRMWSLQLRCLTSGTGIELWTRILHPHILGKTRVDNRVLPLMNLTQIIVSCVGAVGNFMGVSCGDSRWGTIGFRVQCRSLSCPNKTSETPVNA